MLDRRIVAAVIAAGSAVPCAAATAEPTARVDYTDAFTTRAPATASGRVFHDEFFAAGDSAAKPPATPTQKAAAPTHTSKSAQSSSRLHQEKQDVRS